MMMLHKVCIYSYTRSPVPLSPLPRAVPRPVLGTINTHWLLSTSWWATNAIRMVA